MVGSAPLRFALVSRELFPLARGGIAAVVAQLARVLREYGEVTVLTDALYEPRYHELVAQGDPALPPEDVRIAFVTHPSEEDTEGWFGFMHRYSANVLDRLRELYPDGGPDVVEFNDYLGEGAVTLQAHRACEPLLRGTTVAVRLHTTQEICNVLDGELDHGLGPRLTHELERYSLRHADVLLYGGGDILDTYRRYYGAGNLAPAVPSRHPVADAPASEALVPEQVLAGDAPLKVLYLGRMERRKGVQDLVRAVTETPDARFHVTLVGGDTRTAPLGLSIRRQLELMVADDSRMTLLDHVERDELPALLSEHQAVIVPSRWECWPNVALEALRANRPVLATPVGGLVEMAADGGGMLADDTGIQAVGKLLARAVEERGVLGELIADGAPRQRFDALTDEREIADGYLELGRRRRNQRAHPGEAAVSVVIPYFRMHRYVAETVESVFAQTWRALEVIVVDDGSLREEDAVLDDLANRFPLRVVTQPNAGLAAARNLGIRVSRGRYVLPLDADDLLHPTFVERCVAVLDADPSLAYVTSWLRHVNEAGEPDDALGDGYQPLGNELRMLDEMNVGGSAIAVFPRRVFERGYWYCTDLTSYEDWMHLITLRNAGLLGQVIPERLISYRVRAQSMLRQVDLTRRARLLREMRAYLRESEVTWTSSNA